LPLHSILFGRGIKGRKRRKGGDDECERKEEGKNARVDSMLNKMSACLLDDFFIEKKKGADPSCRYDTLHQKIKKIPDIESSSRPNGVTHQKYFLLLLIFSFPSIEMLKQEKKKMSN
jgi:hypothetical protein